MHDYADLASKYPDEYASYKKHLPPRVQRAVDEHQKRLRDPALQQAAETWRIRPATSLEAMTAKQNAIRDAGLDPKDFVLLRGEREAMQAYKDQAKKDARTKQRLSLPEIKPYKTPQPNTEEAVGSYLMGPDGKMVDLLSATPEKRREVEAFQRELTAMRETWKAEQGERGTQTRRIKKAIDAHPPRGAERATPNEQTVVLSKQPSPPKSGFWKRLTGLFRS